MLSAIPKNGFQMLMANLDIVFWGRRLHKYKHIYTYMKSSFSKHNLLTWD